MRSPIRTSISSAVSAGRSSPSSAAAFTRATATARGALPRSIMTGFFSGSLNTIEYSVCVGARRARHRAPSLGMNPGANTKGNVTSFVANQSEYNLYYTHTAGQVAILALRALRLVAGFGATRLHVRRHPTSRSRCSARTTFSSALVGRFPGRVRGKRRRRHTPRARTPSCSTGPGAARRPIRSRRPTIRRQRHPPGRVGPTSVRGGIRRGALRPDGYQRRQQDRFGIELGRER